MGNNECKCNELVATAVVYGICAGVAIAWIAFTLLGMMK